MIVLSLQSGTSADGIDVAVVEVAAHDAGERPSVGMRLLHAATVAWSAEGRDRILAASAGESLTAGAFCELDTLLGQAFADAAATGMEATGAVPNLVVSHGQTIFHWVEHGHARGTLQLGEPSWIAERVGAPVLSHLRAADIAAGGEGAPLMAVFDAAWLGAEAAQTGRAIATANLGGIANVQLVRPHGDVLAFDSGPGNGLIDAVVARATEGALGYDADGRLAAAGRVDPALLAALLRHPYFSATTPKTTGRETFDLGVVDRAVAVSGTEALPLEDLAATLTELTARTVVDAVAPGGDASLDVADDGPALLLCSGGGALNPALMARITALAADRGLAVETSDRRGIDPSFKESLMFAFLGFLSWHGVPARLSGDARGEPRIAGRLTPGPAGLHLPPPLTGVASVSISSTESGGTPS
ncbi:anhydro-N-acetylmuramic acid kinase [Agromyces sp. 3263]|uniref:anhydro-N-acetylmuramic acid kinase n=1 Tax=Agromyces sp. 3263 TaxID=2817750 RepID=UPI0028634346|nr:anhydro-N-acetylmuramic acid kinase [Agromyces sp. 3263]MDR6906487.1 anhydro-N-acetylmuramic acid kinase [Agromyces sp. 3263]